MADVLRARVEVRPYLRPTPLFSYPALSRLVGTEVWVKHENHQPVGAFKVRGGVNLISQLSAVPLGGCCHSIVSDRGGPGNGRLKER